MKHTKENELQIEDSLIYRIGDDGSNCDEINVTMWNGSRGVKERNNGVNRVLLCINACAGLTNEQLESGYIQNIINDYNKSLIMTKELSEILEDFLKEFKDESL